MGLMLCLYLFTRQSHFEGDGSISLIRFLKSIEILFIECHLVDTYLTSFLCDFLPVSQNLTIPILFNYNCRFRWEQAVTYTHYSLQVNKKMQFFIRTLNILQEMMAIFFKSWFARLFAWRQKNIYIWTISIILHLPCLDGLKLFWRRGTWERGTVLFEAPFDQITLYKFEAEPYWRLFICLALQRF